MTQKDDFLGMLARTDPWINAITPQRIERAIEGFPHLFAVGWDSARLADRIQDAATFSRERIPQGNSEAKAELLKLARKSKELR